MSQQFERCYMIQLTYSSTTARPTFPHTGTKGGLEGSGGSLRSQTEPGSTSNLRVTSDRQAQLSHMQSQLLGEIPQLKNLIVSFYSFLKTDNK